MNELESDMQFLQDLLTLHQIEIRIREDKDISDDKKIQILKKIRFERNLLLMNPFVEDGDIKL